MLQVMMATTREKKHREEAQVGLFLKFVPIPKLPSLLLSLLVLMALTGFACTHKTMQAEDDCLSSNVLCYECDSRQDPNCADPFDFSATSFLELANTTNETLVASIDRQSGNFQEQHLQHRVNGTRRVAKRLPHVANCHGCCVKLSSKTPEGETYVRRTCTSSLQINYFMVGLVCMKESGDRGKMCFCEQDYCNGQMGRFNFGEVNNLWTFLLLLLSIFLSTLV